MDDPILTFLDNQIHKENLKREIEHSMRLQLLIDQMSALGVKFDRNYISSLVRRDYTFILPCSYLQVH